ncbi:MAG: porin family protein [Saprospiraceae bacterium]
MKLALTLLLVCTCFLVANAQVEPFLRVSEMTSKRVSVDLESFTENDSWGYVAGKKNAKGLKFLFGLKAGASTANIAADEVAFENAGRQFKLAVDQNEFSYHIGVFGQLRLNHWAIQPEVLFRSAKADYMLSELISTEFVTSIRTEKYAYVDVPLMIAYRMGALRVQAGPVAKFYIDSSTELIGVANLTQSHKQIDLGYQAGIGLDIWRLVVDLKYDRDIDPVGDHMQLAGEPLNFNSTAGRFVFSIGYSLVSP